MIKRLKVQNAAIDLHPTISDEILRRWIKSRDATDEQKSRYRASLAARKKSSKSGQLDF
jgi:hypothetical protein